MQAKQKVVEGEGEINVGTLVGLPRHSIEEKKQNQATHIPQHDDKTEIASAAREKAHSILSPLSSSDEKKIRTHF